MPTLYELFFWIGAFIAVIVLWGLLTKKDDELYVSDYELERLNGNKY